MKTPEPTNREREIFQQAIEISSVHERIEFIKAACRDDAALVESFKPYAEEVLLDQIMKEEAAEGIEKKIPYRKHVPCGKCAGSGAEAGARKSRCPTCHGQGQVIRSQGFFQMRQTCPSCGHISPENRPSRAVFRCVKCAHTGHADVIAAQNIMSAGLAATVRGGALGSGETGTAPQRSRLLRRQAA